jgi:UDP-glucose:(heptosyl)LPS alpha-1,3-glucosyltransferase
MNSPRIALVRARYTPFGGAERFVANAMEALRAHGASITLVTREWPQSATGAALVCNPFYLGNVWRDWGFARAVCRRLAGERFDLVQSHERIACCDIFRAGDGVHREWLKQRAIGMSNISKIKVALNPYHAYIRYAEAKLFRSSRLKAIICNSQMVKNEIQEWFETPMDKLHVIYSGVDIDRFSQNLRIEHSAILRKQINIPADATVYLHVGSGFERKGVEFLIAAFARLPVSSHLVIVGKDKSQAHFVRMAVALGISARTHFVGAISDVSPYYGVADVFVLPTIYDPFPNAILEAMASGLPVITSFKSGGAEIIRNGVNGFVGDARDVDALVVHMKSLMPLASHRMAGQAAREAAVKFTWAAMSNNLKNLYTMILSGAENRHDELKRAI